MILLRMMSFRPLREGMQLQDSSQQTQDTSKKKTVTAEPAKKEIEQKVEQKSQVSEAAPPWEEHPPELERDPVVAVSSKTVSAPKTNKQADIESKPNHPNNKQQWHQVVPQLKLSGRAAELIKHCLLVEQDSGIISLSLDKSSEGLLADSIQQEIEIALSAFYNEKLSLTLAVDDTDDTKVVTSNSQGETPAQRSSREKTEVQRQAEQNIATDPFVLELQNRFGAQVVPGSVHPK